MHCSSIPALVHLSFLVCDKVGFALKEFCAFLAVVLAQTRQVFYGFRILELCEMFLVAQVGVDLVEIARVATCLLFGVLSPDGRHIGLWLLNRIRGRSAVGLKMWRRVRKRPVTDNLARSVRTSAGKQNLMS